MSKASDYFNYYILQVVYYIICGLGYRRGHYGQSRNLMFYNKYLSKFLFVMCCDLFDISYTMTA